MRLFEFDNLRELLGTMKQSKLRTFLTGFSVSWGIFMLIILLGAGNGLKNGVSSNFEDNASNAIELWPRRTAIPYKGLKVRRKIRFRDSDVAALKQTFPQIDKISGYISRDCVISYKNDYGSYELIGIMPEFQHIRFPKIEAGNGRYINPLDISELRKTAVLSQRAATNLFRDEDPIGKYISIDGITFMVVGIDTKSEREERGYCYIPYSTAQALYNNRGYADRIMFTVNGLNTVEANEAFSTEVQKLLAKRLIVHPDDLRTFGIWNKAVDYVQTLKIFSTIQIFVLIIGICTLIAGIVGVGNIMIITVKERTREFGIKKAIGATPAKILSSVLTEAILITASFGYIGMIVGIGILEIVNKIMSASAGSGNGPNMFKNPSVDLGTVLLATLILILAGLLAGYLPARKAVNIKPVEAMRAE